MTYEKTLLRFPERKAEIRKIAFAIQSKINLKIGGASGTGKSSILRSLLEESGVNYVYTYGPQHLSIRSALGDMCRDLKKIAVARKVVAPQLDRFVTPKNMEECDKILNDIGRRLLLPLQENKQHVFIVFDRCQSLGDDFLNFEKRVLHRPNDVELTNTSCIYVDEYYDGVTDANGVSNAELSVLFNPYKENDVKAIMTKLFQEHEIRDEFIKAFLLKEYFVRNANFGQSLSVATAIYEEILHGKLTIPQYMARPLAMNKDVFLHDFVDNISDFAKLVVIAGFLCRCNPPEYDEIFWKKRLREKVSKEVLESKVFVGYTLEPMWDLDYTGMVRFGEKSFKWARLWAWTEMLFSEIAFFKGQKFPTFNDARVLAICPLRDSQLLQFFMEDSISKVQCRASNRIACLCAEKLGITLGEFSVNLPMGRSPDINMRKANRR